MTSAARRVRVRASASGEAGFSLVETIVAMTVAALVFGAVGGILLVSLKATLVGRQAQQAADLANRTVEQMRNRDYTTLGLASADAATDPAITASGYAVPLSNGTTTVEPVVLLTTSPISQHVTTMTLDGTSFTVARYVTSPPADAVAGNAYRRVTAVVSWTTGSRTRSRSTSTLVGIARRGLPAPASNLRLTAPPSVSRGGVFTVAVAVTNLGVRSRWTITTRTTIGSVTRPWRLAWYSDSGATGACNGVRDADETTRMDPAFDGIADTGLLTSEAKGCLVGQYTVPAAELQGSATFAVTATVNTASSVDQTQSATSTQSAQVTVQ